ncbi:protein of unknown function DUF4057 [Dillenia turbinata]|uniref:DUF4057 domain-containing protein n=1 Tax=Dillenia turbinata TaxID=194707 RepID=A0AAN8ZK84_9MAGN
MVLTSPGNGDLGSSRCSAVGMSGETLFGHKLKEITGSGIFAADEDDAALESGSANTASNNRTGLRMYQQALAGISQISFSVEENNSPRKPTSLPEVAKQHELSGTLESEADSNVRKVFLTFIAAVLIEKSSGEENADANKENPVKEPEEKERHKQHISTPVRISSITAPRDALTCSPFWVRRKSTRVHLTPEPLERVPQKETIPDLTAAASSG